MPMATRATSFSPVRKGPFGSTTGQTRRSRGPRCRSSIEDQRGQLLLTVGSRDQQLFDIPQGKGYVDFHDGARCSSRAGTT